ncbi:fasciclin domain-containing protein [Pseudonocardia petroleophila]|uniref:Fasciclin domain-containing protein n=1 Tax=Pseudonocardia petroleophila TaxID=37331 RepID=A0A7G7MIW9_9PSEU|nr:fasciclin domain-containing protein [Pseudonocardia petroleophila]QNG52730.1 fasciclin domain-containing protein [Pseudonocardia petroleophila]
MTQSGRSRLTRLASATALAALLTGCAGDTVPADRDVGPGVYGPVCARVPIEGATFPGTVADLVEASAGGADPLLSTLAGGLRVTGLRDALADPAAELTVFAPTDAAFEALPAGTVPRWQQTDVLDDVLSGHVVTGRYDADALATVEAVGTLGGEPLVVSGDPASLVIGERAGASVLCGNIRATNGTVFVVDEVLRPEGVG